jgi:UDP-N-acetyl-D-glucosamine dehydrogenase
MKITVVGLGYVGLPLALLLCENGHTVYGYDIDYAKIQDMITGKEVSGVSCDLIRKYFNKTFFPIHHHPLEFSKYDTDFYFICVPTPYTKSKQPDLSHIKSASKLVGHLLKKNQMVVLQSTSYPGTLNEVVVPILEVKSGSRYEKGDFGVAFMAERIDPGRNVPYHKIPKVVGCNHAWESERLFALMESCNVPLVLAPSPEAAEMTKLLENTFRAVNIGFINEMARLCERMGLDIWRIIELAKTKPYGFMPFYPGPGVGGHCIPIDPYYLLQKAMEHNLHMPVLRNSLASNEFMPEHVLGIVNEVIARQTNGCRLDQITFFGITYKPNVKDTRESPYRQIKKAGSWDFRCYVPDVLDFEQTVENTKVAVILINESLDYQYIIDNTEAVVDCCNATQFCDTKGKVYKLGYGWC